MDMLGPLLGTVGSVKEVPGITSMEIRIYVAFRNYGFTREEGQ